MPSNCPGPGAGPGQFDGGAPIGGAGRGEESGDVPCSPSDLPPRAAPVDAIPGPRRIR
jgi:hypothetical protein